MVDKAKIRQLVPKRIHFDGYNKVSCRTRDDPFFSTWNTPMGKYNLSVRYNETRDSITITFQSPCPFDVVKYTPYVLSLDEFVDKLRKAVRTDSDFITLEITPDTDGNFGCSRSCSNRNNDCNWVITNKPKTVSAAVSFDIEDVKEALDYRNIDTNTNGGTIMGRNKFFGVNYEFGPSHDPNLKSTLFGIAVREFNGGSWYTYDPVNKVHKNLASMQFGNFPIFLLPTVEMQPGDLIKRNGKYVWIREKTPEGTFKALDALSGQIIEILPTESIIPAFNLYTKVVAMDMNSMKDSSGNNLSSNLLGAMMLMQWSKNDGKTTTWSLKDIDEDSFNGMGGMLWLAAQSGGGNLGKMFRDENGKVNLPMLMMLGGSDSDGSDFMQMMVISQLLGGGNGLEGLIPGFAAPTQTTPPTMTAPTRQPGVVCDKCGKTYDEGWNFCPTCGQKTHPIGTFCKKCGALLMDGAHFCHICGEKIGPATCPKCHAEVPEGAAFCTKCGQNLSEAVTVDAATTAPESTAVPTTAAAPATKSTRGSGNGRKRTPKASN